MTTDPLANIEVSPQEVKQRLDRGEEFLFVDVREPWEYETTRIEGSKLIPMRQIPANLAARYAQPRRCGMAALARRRRRSLDDGRD